MSNIKKVKIVKRPRKRKMKIIKLSSMKKGGSIKKVLIKVRKSLKRGKKKIKKSLKKKRRGKKGVKKGGKILKYKCRLDYKAPRGGALCVGERLHDCLKRETDKNSIRARPSNGSSTNYTLHGKYPRFPIDQSKAISDMGKRVNKRSERHVKRIADGKFVGGATKGQYTGASLKRLMSASPQYAMQHAELAKPIEPATFGKGGAKNYSASRSNKSGSKIKKKRGRPKKKGGASGYKKAKSRAARIGRISVKPKSVKKAKKKVIKKGGASGYKKSKNRQARIDSHSVQPRKPVQDSSKFA